jgi:hypothetical protein
MNVERTEKNEVKTRPAQMPQPGNLVYWSGPDANNAPTEWVTLRASEYDQLAKDAARWRGLREPPYD